MVTDMHAAARRPEERWIAMMLKAVFWDMDGTLIDSEPYWHAGEMEIAKANGGYWDQELAYGRHPGGRDRTLRLLRYSPR